MHDTLADGVFGAIGQTPLIRLPALSALVGAEILAKAENQNPGGSVKDRTAKGIILDAERRGLLGPGGIIVEGTAGNTGIGIAMLARARGYRAIIVMPDNQAPEKYEYLRLLGADVRAVPATKFADPEHFYHTAKRIAEETPGAFWADQFENPANERVHYETTGPEIWAQAEGKVDALVLSSGTGGTIGGISRYLKEKNPRVHVTVADPLGSGLFSYVKTGKIESEGTSITEGIGIMRLTFNFSQAKIDDAVQVGDDKVVAMAHWLLRREGLLVGGSSALNIFAAAQIAKRQAAKRPGARVVTMICDGGGRYQSRLFNPAWLKEKGLWPGEDVAIEAWL